jgi:predicted O-methyltransferase YrrM
MKTHIETFLRIEDLGSQIPRYQPTFAFPHSFIDTTHQSLAHAPLRDEHLIQLRDRRWFGNVIPGWLRREDALKLYELAYFTAGDILELGCYHGLSTSICARAVRNSKQFKRVYTVDLSPAHVKATQRNLRRLGLQQTVTNVCEDALAAVRRFAALDKRFGFVFIDHSHTYEAVVEVCHELDKITAVGGFCLFHDYNDGRNSQAEEHDFGVYQAVMDGLDLARFEFYGIYGCTGLYRAVGAKEQRATG